MEFLRRVTIWLITSLFFSSLIFIAYGWTFNETIARGDTVKSWIERSGAYDNITSELVASSLAEQDVENVSIDESTLITAADNSFTPQRLQTALESVLDGAYDWLDGKSESLSFSLDFTDANNDFRNEIVSAAEAKLTALPPCLPGEATPSIDPFQSSCLPTGANVDAFVDDFAEQALSEDVSPVDSTISSGDITTEDGESLEDQLAFLPPAWQIAKRGAVIAIAAAFISAIALYALARDRVRLLLQFFRGFLYAGITLGIFTFFTSRSSGWLETAFGENQAASGFASNVLQPIFTVAAEDITFWTFRFTIAYLVIALLFLLLYFERKQRAKVLSKKSPQRLENIYRKIVKKPAKKYNRTNLNRREAIQTKVSKKKKPH